MSDHELVNYSLPSTHSGPFVMVIFGATGDLAVNKLFPALFSMYKNKLLPQRFYVVGFSRRNWGDDDFRKFLHDKHIMSKSNKKEFIDPYLSDQKIEEDEEKLWAMFVENIYYQHGIFDEPFGYEALIKKLVGFDEEIGACITRIFYLATPPDNYLSILTNLDSSKLSEGCGQGSDKWTRIAIEKPFGRDLDTAKMLDQKLGQIFSEKQVFRIDHYLGKETIQNMLAFRFANSIFEPLWNSEYIDHIQITFAEKEGIKTRGKFFEGTGIMRDVAQNHILQMLAAVAMEQPRSFTKEEVRDARANAIKSIRCIEPSDVKKSVIRGQYKTYLSEQDVAADSMTETFVAMKLMLENERFANVPFYIRAGKKMPQEMMEISVVFKQTCHILFKEYGCPEIGNVLTFRIQPDEGIKMRVITKKPGMKLALETVDMKFNYIDHVEHRIVDAYEKVLLDILSGDQMLFNRSDELESSWQLITNILKGWEDESVPLYVYDDSTWGPMEANELIEKDGRKWL